MSISPSVWLKFVLRTQTNTFMSKSEERYQGTSHETEVDRCKDRSRVDVRWMEDTGNQHPLYTKQLSPYGQARYLGRRCFAPRGARLLCMQLGDQGSALLHSADGKSSVSLWLLQHSGADCWGRVSERGVSSPVLSDGERAAWQRRGVAFRSHVGRG
eukprot:11225482-Lingulodinium_polyedra.AAC.1